MTAILRMVVITVLSLTLLGATIGTAEARPLRPLEYQKSESRFMATDFHSSFELFCKRGYVIQGYYITDPNNAVYEVRMYRSAALVSFYNHGAPAMAGMVATCRRHR